MHGDHAARVRRWLEDPAAQAAGRASVDRLRAALAGGTLDRHVVVEPHGTVVCLAAARAGAPPRRTLEFDRHGTLLAALRWRQDGALGAAWLRLPDGSWLGIEPSATTAAPWGLSDRLWHAARPPEEDQGPRGDALTVFEALDYGRIDRIPPLLDPASLPPGGGAAALNLLAQLARDQRRARLAYRGPYPTEHLFLSLLESFRYVARGPDARDPLAAFMAGGIEWAPAPHERAAGRAGLLVHLRGRIERVAWQGRVYWRPDWQAVERHAPRRVRDTAEDVRCSLWALGGPIEDHLVLDRDGELLRVLEVPPAVGAPEPMPEDVVGGIVEIVAATSAPPLAPFIRALGAGLTLVWRPVSGDLVAVEAAGAAVSIRLRERLAERLRAAPAAAAAAEIALVALAEIAGLLGDDLRRRAQARVAALPAVEQERALTAAPAPAGDGAAHRIAAAVAALLTSSRG